MTALVAEAAALLGAGDAGDGGVADQPVGRRRRGQVGLADGGPAGVVTRANLGRGAAALTPYIMIHDVGGRDEWN